MRICKEVHTSIYKGVTTVVRCHAVEHHGPWHRSEITWYSDVAPPENWQPGDVVVDSRSRIFYHTLSGLWMTPGSVDIRNYEYPTRPLVKLVPERTP